jgi:hypothetical protein
MPDLTRSRTLALMGCLVLTILLAAAADKREEEIKRPPTSGFLGDYSDLQPHPDKKQMLVYRKRPGVLADYDAFLVEPVLIYFHKDAKGTGVDPQELAQLATFLRDEVVRAISESRVYRAVDSPGPGVVRLRAAITHVVPVDPKKNIGATALGMAAGVGLLLPRVDLGRTSIEVEFLDSESGERLAAVVAEKKGRRFGGKVKGAKTWGDVKAAFKKWSKGLRQRLDQIHQE